MPLRTALVTGLRRWMAVRDIRIISLPRLLCGALGVILATGAGPAWSDSIGLQVDTPWMTSGTNSGSVGTTGVTATSSNNRWNSDFGDDRTFWGRMDLYGPLALDVGTPGDTFVLSFGPGTMDTLTIELSGSLMDPIFFINDIDIAGASVTVSPGGTAFFASTDGVWNGNTLTSVGGAPETLGAFGAVQYGGLHSAGSSFTFQWDYSSTSGFSSEDIAIGIGLRVPEPHAALLLLIAVGGAARYRSRAH